MIFNSALYEFVWGKLTSLNGKFRAALDAIREWLEDYKEHVDMIILCRFDNEDRGIYDMYLHNYVPVL